MYELHYYPGNASFTPHVILRELDIPFKLTRVDRGRNAQKSTDYLKLNPAGRIPTLVDGDFILFETAAICLHLADTHPDAGLAPAFGTRERAHFYKWLMFLTNTIQPEVLMFYYHDRYTKNPDCGPAIKEAVGERLVDWFRLIEDDLDDGSHFLGGTFSLLDIYLTMVSRWGRFLPTPPRDLPKIGALARRTLERPSVQAAIEAEEIEGDFLT